MTAFLDTTALLALYLDEPGAMEVRGFVEVADRRVVCSIAWLEAHGALTRRVREGRASEAIARRALEHLTADRDAFTGVHVDDALARLAGAVAERHGLDGLAALHVAAALVERRRGHTVRFLTLDEGLAGAAAHYVTAP